MGRRVDQRDMLEELLQVNAVVSPRDQSPQEKAVCERISAAQEQETLNLATSLVKLRESPIFNGKSALGTTKGQIGQWRRRLADVDARMATLRAKHEAEMRELAREKHCGVTLDDFAAALHVYDRTGVPQFRTMFHFMTRTGRFRETPGVPTVQDWLDYAEERGLVCRKRRRQEPEGQEPEDGDLEEGLYSDDEELEVGRMPVMAEKRVRRD